MEAAASSGPEDVEALRAALAAAQTRADVAEAELAAANAKASDDQAQIAHQQREIAKLRRQLYGTRSERAQRLHGDDTAIPVLAKGKTNTGRLWVYARDDGPFAGPAPPAAVFHYSRDRRGEHPKAHLAGWSGILQADANGGFGDLYAHGREPAPIIEASCWAHGRRKGFELADIETAAIKTARGEKPKPVYPLALEALQRIDAIFAIAAERALRGVALGRKAWLFCGSDRGGQRAAVLYSLIVTPRIKSGVNDIDPQAWLVDVLARLPAHPARQIDELLPWNWSAPATKDIAA